MFTTNIRVYFRICKLYSPTRFVCSHSGKWYIIQIAYHRSLNHTLGRMSSLHSYKMDSQQLRYLRICIKMIYSTCISYPIKAPITLNPTINTIVMIYVGNVCHANCTFWLCLTNDNWGTSYAEYTYLRYNCGVLLLYYAASRNPAWRYNVTRYCTQHNKFDGKSLIRLRTQ